jgi:xylulokinase
MAILGLDLGSSSIKGAAFEQDGSIIAEASKPYKTTWDNDFAEADAEQIWHATIDVIKDIARQVPSIEAICAGSHGETFIPVDNNLKPVYPAIMNADNRAYKESEAFEKDIGKRDLYKITGVPLHPMFSINKINWLKKNRPEIFSAADMFLTPQEYVLGKLGARPLIDYSLACRMMALDINRHTWSNEILNASGLTIDMLPNCVPSGTIAGTINDRIAEMLGLKKGVRVVVGGHDQPLSALGCGAIGKGDVNVSAGTYECVAAISNLPNNNEAAFKYSLNSYCHVLNDKFITLAFFPAGLATSWFVEEFCGLDRQKAKEEGISEYLYISRLMPKEPTGICITPHLIGSCNPYWDSRARGAIYGIAPDSSRHKLFKAVYEGLALELDLNIRALSQVCGDFNHIRISGGNARWPFSVQLRADITGKVFHTIQDTNAVCRGAAILAGVATGIYKDYADAIKHIVKINREFKPDIKVNESYKKQKAMYAELYPALEKLRSI